MASPIDNGSLNQQHSQPNSLLLLLCLPILQYLTAFLTKLVEEIQQKQETNECTRLINLIINEVSKQTRHRKEPDLRRKSYNELRAYINKYYPELSNQI